MTTPRHDGPTRRQLLAAAAGLPVLAWWPSPWTRPSGAAPDDGGRVLVVVELEGGNDGLNTVVPYADDLYHRQRPVLAVEPQRVLRLTDTVGLNPPLVGLRTLWDQGELHVVQGVGSPEASRSHFRCREIWHTARVDHPAPAEGWLARCEDALGDGALPLVRAGATDLPAALGGARSQVPVLASLQAFALRPPPGSVDAAALSGSTRGREGAVEAVARAMADARRASSQLADLGLDHELPGAPSRLGRSLGLAARLIAADVGTRVLYVTHGGYDTHADQRVVQNGNHRELAEALLAFQRALHAQGDADRVTTLVFSEFGRRVTENASQGTDHGAGNPVLLVGAPVHGGLSGLPPELDGPGDHDVPVTLDFRRVYAELLSWLGVPQETALPGRFETLGVVG